MLSEVSQGPTQCMKQAARWQNTVGIAVVTMFIRDYAFHVWSKVPKYSYPQGSAADQ